MKLTLEPTNEFATVDGLRMRLWRGTTDGGEPVRAWIRTVQAETKAADAELEQALERLWPNIQPEMKPIDARFIV